MVRCRFADGWKNISPSLSSQACLVFHYTNQTVMLTEEKHGMVTHYNREMQVLVRILQSSHLRKGKYNITSFSNACTKLITQNRLIM